MAMCTTKASGPSAIGVVLFVVGCWVPTDTVAGVFGTRHFVDGCRGMFAQHDPPGHTEGRWGAPLQVSCRCAARHDSLDWVCHTCCGPMKLHGDVIEHPQTLGIQHGPQDHRQQGAVRPVNQTVLCNPGLRCESGVCNHNKDSSHRMARGRALAGDLNSA